MVTNKGLSVSKNQIQRLPMYLNHLKKLRDAGFTQISAPQVAKDLGLHVEKVKKDIALVSSSLGTPKSGRNIDDLIADITSFLNYDEITPAIIIGCGQLGRALLGYRGFDEYGLDIVAGFDINPELVGQDLFGKTIYALEDLPMIRKKYKVDIGIITVPGSAAQEAANALVDAGILAIWNFAPAHIQVADKIIVHDENMASSLAVLSHRLSAKMSSKK